MTRSSSSRSRTCAASNATDGSTTIVPPIRMSGAIEPIAPMWNIGEATRLTSCSLVSS